MIADAFIASLYSPRVPLLILAAVAVFSAGWLVLRRRWSS